MVSRVQLAFLLKHLFLNNLNNSLAVLRRLHQKHKNPKLLSKKLSV
jgi:hypothetical protein